MGAHCQICEKGPTTGRTYVRRGLAKAKGGVGRKITGKTKRWFQPNVQHIKVVEANGHVHRLWVCTKCIKSNRVVKAPNQTVNRQFRAAMAEAKKA